MYIHIFASQNSIAMKKYTLALFVLAASLTACSDTPKGDEASVTDEKAAADSNGVAMTVDTATSIVGFVGNGVGKNHPGEFKLSSGTFTVKDGKVTAGSFTVNVGSIKMLEQGDMFQTNLRGHLMSADFFDVAKFPEAKFEITGSEPFTPTATDSSVVAGANTKISGNLTLKGVTKNVTFPAKVEVTEAGATTQANFNIDRTQWDMHYNDDEASAKEKFIQHDVNIKLNITSKKQ
jgi:polyisoprenoid-binding protein YceI